MLFVGSGWRFGVDHTPQLRPSFHEKEAARPPSALQPWRMTQPTRGFGTARQQVTQPRRMAHPLRSCPSQPLLHPGYSQRLGEGEGDDRSVCAHFGVFSSSHQKFPCLRDPSSHYLYTVRHWTHKLRQWTHKLRQWTHKLLSSFERNTITRATTRCPGKRLVGMVLWQDGMWS